jgi:hypothetical protein
MASLFKVSLAEGGHAVKPIQLASPVAGALERASNTFSMKLLLLENWS